jgi:hypothetical protein
MTVHLDLRINNNQFKVPFTESLVRWVIFFTVHMKTKILNRTKKTESLTFQLNRSGQIRTAKKGSKPQGMEKENKKQIWSRNRAGTLPDCRLKFEIWTRPRSALMR